MPQLAFLCPFLVIICKVGFKNDIKMESGIGYTCF